MGPTVVEWHEVYSPILRGELELNLVQSLLLILKHHQVHTDVHLAVEEGECVT